MSTSRLVASAGCAAGHAQNNQRMAGDLDGRGTPPGGAGRSGTRSVPLELPPEHLFTCSVGRNRLQARCAPVLCLEASVT